MTPEAAVPAPAPLADAAARARALAITDSLIVRAPAGSGKTELLIQRFLRLLAEVDQPEAVVALTFSRQAAAEMRGRLLQALKERTQTPPCEPHQRQTWELARAAQARDAERGWRLSEAPARLRVMTLDALALDLVERMPWLSRLGAPPRPTESPEALYATAARATLARIETPSAPGAAAARRLLAHLHADLDATEALIADMLGRRDQWLGWTVAGGDRHAQRAAIEAAVAAIVAGELARAHEDLLENGWKRGLPELPPATTDALDLWHRLADTVLTKAGEPRAAWKKTPLDQRVYAVLGRIRRLPLPGFDPASWEIVEALLDLLPLAAAELSLAFLERGECDFTEVTLAAVRALGTADAPSTLAYALDARLQHLFVDEFQDTSQAQYPLLRALVADWTPGDGRTLFLVGDPMQSIYGWRNAEVGLFLRTEAQARLGPLPLAPIQLSANFRSQAGLVSWCNRHFGAVSPPQEDLRVGATRFAEATPTRPALAPSAVLHALPGHNPYTEAVRIAEVVEAELPQLPAGGTIAILVQNRAHLRAILPELQRRGLRYQGVKLHALAQSPVVSDLWALTRALHHPADRVAWLAVLRAPWCGLTLADLHALCHGDGAGTLSERLADPECRGRLSPDGQARLARAAPILTEAARQRERRPMRLLIEWCWRTLGGAELAPPGSLGHAREFLQLLAEFDERGGHGLEALSQAMAKRRAPADASPGVPLRVMTAHEAKGLEFDVVILPGLDRTPRTDPPALLRWLERPADEADAPARWLIAPKPERGGSDALYELLGNLQQRQRNQEQLRLLYVGATRARERLHLLAFFPVNRDASQLGDPAPRSPLARIWPAVRDEFEHQFRQQRSDSGLEAMEELSAHIAGAEPAPKPPQLWRVPTAWTPSPLPPDVTWQGMAWAEPPSEAPAVHVHAAALQRQVGTVVHTALQHMAERGELRWDPRHLRQWLWQAGTTPAHLDLGLARVVEALERTVADPRGRWILTPHEQAQCEWALAGLDDGRFHHAILDRTFVEADIRWIIDYKNASHQGGGLDAFLEQQVELYRPQLQTYCRLLAAIEPHPIRCGIYFPLLAAWRELTP